MTGLQMESSISQPQPTSVGMRNLSIFETAVESGDVEMEDAVEVEEGPGTASARGMGYPSVATFFHED